MASRKTIKRDLTSITGANSTYFSGVDDLVNIGFDPIVTGYSFIKWIGLPGWFQEDEDLRYFDVMTQKNFRSFSGVEDVTLTTLTHQTGFAGNEFDVAGGITRGNTEFTIGHKEYSGGVMRKMYQKWITYIRDPRTGIALYPRIFPAYDYGARNHTGQLLFVSVRPDVTNVSEEADIIEYAAFYTNVIPTNVPLGTLYNYELGTQDSPTIDITFKGFVEIGPDVEDYAKKVLREQILNPEQNGIVFVDSYGTNVEATEIFQDPNVLKNIFGNR
jgi:hypothetical protein